jgi:hypothetical protein
MRVQARIRVRLRTMALRSKIYLQTSPRLAPTAGILGTTVLTIALSAALTSLIGENYLIDPPFLEPFRAPTRDEAMLTYPAEYALKSTEYSDVLFLGDSTCRCSIDPIEFQRLSGLSAYNLGSMGGLGMDGYGLILQAYLKHHPSPRAVVLALTPDGFDVAASDALGTWPHRFRCCYGPDREAKLRVPDNLESLKFFAQRGARIARDYWADSFAERRFDPRVEPLYGSGRDTYLTLERKIRQTRGYWDLVGKHWPGGTDPPDKGLMPVATQWDTGLRELVKFANANDVPLIIRLVPLVDTTKTDFQLLRRWLNDVQRDYPRLIIIRPEVLLYGAEYCWDFQHLNAAGVEKFSRSLAKDIAAALSQISKRPPGEHQSNRAKGKVVE